MLQPDLFPSAVPDAAPVTDQVVEQSHSVVGLLEQLSASCERPRYNYMLLTLIAEASDRTGSAGPFVEDGGRVIPIRDWLCDALSPLARQEPRRRAIFAKVREELIAAGKLPAEKRAAEQAVSAEVRVRLRRSGRTNVSRAVTELVRLGLLRRHYQGYRVDHHNRGAQRQAVYTVTDETRRALARIHCSNFGDHYARRAAGR